MARRRTVRKSTKNHYYGFDLFSLFSLFIIIVIVSFFLVSFKVLAVTNIALQPISCTTTPLVLDGKNLTAAVFNPPPGTITGEVDATGCDIGIYVNHGNWTIDGANVHGSTYYGIVADGSSNAVSVDINNSEVYQIGEIPFSAAEHGTGIYYTGNASGTVGNSFVYRYQKSGIVVSGNNANVNVEGNTVKGLGSVDFISQNAVEYASGANGSVTNNRISDSATGVLLQSSGNVVNSQNHFLNNKLDY